MWGSESERWHLNSGSASWGPQTRFLRQLTLICKKKGVVVVLRPSGVAVQLQVKCSELLGGNYPRSRCTPSMGEGLFLQPLPTQNSTTLLVFHILGGGALGGCEINLVSLE